MSVHVIGDVHGERDKLKRLLRREGLVDDQLRWCGGRSTLCFVGDLVDRGADGVGVIELVMRLEAEAAAAGGRVVTLLGNHDVQLVAAHRFGEARTTGPGGTFRRDWRANGGVEADLRRLRPEHVAWIARLPAMVRMAGHMIVHADAMFYLEYGRDLQTVNLALARLMAGDDTAAFDRLLEQFSGHGAFLNGGAEGEARAATFTNVFGGATLVHGHTPIFYATRRRPEEVAGPLVYAHGRCVNVDGGMAAGGAGFLYRLEPEAQRTS